MISAGIDIGSSNVKAVVLDGTHITFREVVPSASRPFDVARELAGKLPPCPLAVTGYGRDLLDAPSITELKAHALGARKLIPGATTVIDIGAQDLKIIALDKKGSLARFEMNDRCAAGTGRFLEVMAARLGLSLDDFSSLAHKGKNTLAINAMCTVFAESEVIGLLNKNNPLPDIARALHSSVVKKIDAMYRRLEPDGTCIVATGGGARNTMLVELLSQSIETPICLPEDPQIAGALGCAVYAASQKSK